MSTNIKETANNVATKESNKGMTSNESVNFAREHEIARELTKSSALMRLKAEGFDHQLYDIIVNMRAANIVKSRALLAIKHEKKELQNLLDQYSRTTNRKDRDEQYNKIKAKNEHIEKLIRMKQQAEQEYAKNLKLAQQKFDQEFDLIDSKVNAGCAQCPHMLKFFLHLFHGIGLQMKEIAFHLSAVTWKYNQHEKHYINQISEAYKNRNITQMEKTAEQILSDDDKVRNATKNMNHIIDESEKDTIIKLLSELKENHQKLEQALQSRFNTLTEAESMIQAKKQELSQSKEQTQSQNQEPPEPTTPSQAV